MSLTSKANARGLEAEEGGGGDGGSSGTPLLRMVPLEGRTNSVKLVVGES